MTTQRLYEIFYARNRDVYAKITGDEPTSLYNGNASAVERGERVVLYENEREIREYAPDDVLVVENQGISGYTTRLVNQRFVDPDVVVLTNIRQDHRDTLGETRADIARSFARSVPPDTHVVNGEQNPVLKAHLEAELEHSNASITHVSVPDEAADIPGAESIFALNETLAAVGATPVSENVLQRYLEEMRVSWTELPGGKVYNAADVNDIESTDLVRRALCETDTEPIVPLLYLRSDRRSRTASFLSYLDDLYEADVIEGAHAIGDPASLFTRKAAFPVTTHSANRSPSAVLDAVLREGPPVLVMGNTVAEFMREFDAELNARKLPVETKTDAQPLADGSGDNPVREDEQSTDDTHNTQQ